MRRTAAIAIQRGNVKKTNNAVVPIGSVSRGRRPVVLSHETTRVIIAAPLNKRFAILSIPSSAGLCKSAQNIFG
jgi:hypothetical protein